MVTHLHGGEIPSNSDGGPTAWFMPDYSLYGPGFAHDASSVCTYPNQQEGTTLWYHPHDEGLTRINVYCGLAGFYFLRGTNEDACICPAGQEMTWSGK
jgi:spore coat protein A